MKKLFLITTILILSMQGFSQSIDNIVNKYIHDSLATFQTDTTKYISTTGNGSVIGDTLWCPNGYVYNIEMRVVYRDRVTGSVLKGVKSVTLQRNNSGVYAYDNIKPAGTITDNQWTLVMINGRVVVKITPIASNNPNRVVVWALTTEVKDRMPQ